MICCSLPKLVASNQLRHVQSPFIWLKGENILCPDGHRPGNLVTMTSKTLERITVAGGFME